MGWRPKELSLYHLLLKAYPAEFRDEYGREMEQYFADRLETEPRWQVWLGAMADLATSVPREHRAVLAADLRHGLRLIALSPASTAVIVLTMALGIGAATAVFSLVYAALLRSFPYGDVSGLAYVWTPNPRFEGVPKELTPSAADYYDFKRSSRSFSDLALFHEQMFRMGDAAGASYVAGVSVTGNFFPVLQVQPALGRAIDAGDDQPGHGNVVVIGDALWRSRLGGGANVLGRTLRLDRADYTIVGVMPPGFAYPHASDFPPLILEIPKAELWIPAAFTDKQRTDRNLDSGHWESGNIIGRLRPGVSIRQAQSEISAIEARVEPLYPEMYRGWQAYVQSFGDSAAGSVRWMMWLLFGAVSLVLLIACSNVAGLLTARAAGRVHEMGVRAALGAGRSRLVRQMLTESFLLAAGGGALGILFAAAGMRALIRINPGDIPRMEEISLHPAVLAFAVAVSLLTGLLFGLAPALSASRVNLMDLLKQGGNKGATPGMAKRLRSMLVVTEVALAVVLLAAAGLLVRSYVKLQQVEKGFSTSALTTKVNLDEKYRTPQQQREFYSRLLGEIRAVPGVEAAGTVSGIPLGHHESLSFLEVEGYANKKGQLCDIRTVMGDYLPAIGIRMIAGRYLSDGDGPGRPRVSVVSQGFVDAYFAGGNAIGRRLRTGGGPEAPWITIVGVVADVRHSNLEDPPRPVLYIPWIDGSDGNLDIAIRAQTPPEQLSTALRAIVKRLDPDLAAGPVRSMDQLVSEASGRRRFQTVLLTAFAGIALFLPLVGLYGLMAYSVKQRTGEIGIRMTLGASRTRVVGMIVRQGVALVTAGLIFGLAAAFALTRVAASFLYGVTATDPLTFVAVPLLLLLVAATACLIPAWKAARISAVEALRYE